MRHTIIIAAASLIGAGVLAWGSSAHAQEESYLNRPMPAPSNAFELKVGTGYTQGFGLLTPAQSIPDVAGAGFGANLDADYRMLPRWSVGLQGEYQEFANNINANAAARGFAGNLGVTYHVMPYSHGDGLFRIGSGYRLLCSVSPVICVPTTLTQGFEVAKATIGYDVRVSPEVALAPLVGGRHSTCSCGKGAGGVTNSLSSAQVGTFIFAGIQGRFDMGGTTSTPETVAGR